MDTQLHRLNGPEKEVFVCPDSTILYFNIFKGHQALGLHRVWRDCWGAGETDEQKVMPIGSNRRREDFEGHKLERWRSQFS